MLGIYKSLTDTWMWKLRLWLRNSFSRNICFKFSVLVLCSVCWCAYEQLPFLGVNSVVSGKIRLILSSISFDTGLFLPFVPAMLNLMHSVSSSKINSRFYLLIITQQTYLSSNWSNDFLFLNNICQSFALFLCGHRVDRVVRVLSFLSSCPKLGLSHSLARRRVCIPPLPLWFRGEAHSLGEGVGGPNSNEGTDTVVL